MKISSSRIRSFIMGGLLFCFALTSCENFMKGQDIRQEIEESIAYNNAQKCTIVFRADIKYGEFLGSQERVFRVGYESEVQFELNQEDYVFKGLEAVNEDRTVSRSEYVKFEKLSEDKKKGIYKYKVTLLTEAKDIVIQPVCVALPKIDNITPDSAYLTFNQDTQIKFTFNKAIKETTLEKLKYSIYSDDDLLEYYNTPHLSADGKTLYITPLEEKHIISPDDSKNIKSVYLSYDFSEVTDIDNIPLSAKGTHEYKINRTFSGEQAVTVIIPAENTQGRFLSSGEKSCIVGYTLLDIQYTLNKESYKFCGFEAINNNDNSISYNSSVSFLEKDYNEETGIFKAKLLVNENTGAILIKPVCLELPAVISYSPSENATNSANTQISIQFNISMEDSIVQQVLISYAGNTMADYFMTPVLSQDKKTLTIVPKSIDLLNYIGTTGSITINISLPDSITVNKGETTLHLKQDENTSFNITYIYITEKDPPILNAFVVTRDSIDLSTDITKINKFHTDIFLMDEAYKTEHGNSSSVFATQEAKIIDNRMGKTINIYGKFTDTGSGIHKITVCEEYKGYAPDEYLNNTPVKTDYILDLSDDIFAFNTDSNGVTTFCIKHTLKSEDGAVALKLIATDTCENTAESSEIFGFKRTTMAFENPQNLSLYNYLYGLSTNYTEEELAKSIKTLHINCDYEDFLYGWFELPGTIATITCEYKHSDNITRTDTFIPANPNRPSDWDWLLELDVEKINGLSMKITISDDTGNELIKEYTIPSSENLTYIQMQEDNKTYVQFFYTTGESCYFPCLQAIDEDGKKQIYDGNWSDEKLEIFSGYTYMPIPIYVAEKADYVTTYFYAESPQNMVITKDEDTNSTQEFILENYEGTTVPYKITKSETIENISYVSIKIPQSTWTSCQNVCLFVKDKGIILPSEDFRFYESKGNIYRFYEYGSTEYTFPIFTNDLYTSDTQLIIYGISDNKNKYKKDITITKLSSSDTAHDNNPPVWNYTIKDSETYIITIDDYETGASSGWFIEGKDVYETYGNNLNDIYVFMFNSKNRRTYTTDSFRNNTVEIPSWFFNENGFSYYIQDNAGNYYCGNAFGAVYDKWDMKNIDTSTENQMKLTYNVISGAFNYYKSYGYLVYIYKYNSTTNNGYTIWDWDLSNKTLLASQNEGGNITGNSSNAVITLVNAAEEDPQFPVADSTGFFVKIVSALNYPVTSTTFVPTNFTTPYYYYVSNTAHDPSCDLILPNGSSKESVAISSMSPVLVQTIVTEKSYDICKDWSANKWVQRKKIVGELKLDFDSDHCSPKRYAIPVDSIDPGQCYVVIAHFADGHTEMSEVMQK